MSEAGKFYEAFGEICYVFEEGNAFIWRLHVPYIHVTQSKKKFDSAQKAKDNFFEFVKKRDQMRDLLKEVDSYANYLV